MRIYMTLFALTMAAADKSMSDVYDQDVVRTKAVKRNMGLDIAIKLLVQLQCLDMIENVSSYDVCNCLTNVEISVTSMFKYQWPECCVTFIVDIRRSGCSKMKEFMEFVNKCLLYVKHLESCLKDSSTQRPESDTEQHTLILLFTLLYYFCKIVNI
ncbi:uncharacterized protein LOC142338484 isoform X1 [Convolutriloba macropyga]|uniref:uncharacterized protein LOC142338484 isoform X1 n=1 Tax=Convolutriloba macropyga TaxID=536237 RepID=UPI003F52186F